MDQPNVQVAPPSSKSPGTPSHRGRVILGYLLAAGLLVWVFHDVDFGEIYRSAAEMQWRWVALAVVCDVAGYACQGARWSLLLRPVGEVSTLKTTQAIYMGLFANEVLPLRVGEPLRIYLVSRWLAVEFSATLSSALVERFLDAVWLAVLIGIAILVVPLPRYLVDAEEILALGTFGLAALFVFLVVQRQKRLAVHPSPSQSKPRTARLRAKLWRVIDQIAVGLGDIGRSQYLYAAAVYSGLLLLSQILALWLMMLAYGLGVSFWHGAVVLLILHLGTAVPSAPSNVGAYQFFLVVGLTMFGVDKTPAAGFSVVAFLVLTIPLWAIGLFAFAKAGFSLRQVRTEIARIAAFD